MQRRDGLQLDKEKAGEEREKKKTVHDEVRSISIRSCDMLCNYTMQAANARKLQKLPKLADDLQKVKQSFP